MQAISFTFGRKHYNNSTNNVSFRGTKDWPSVELYIRDEFGKKVKAFIKPAEEKDSFVYSSWGKDSEWTDWWKKMINNSGRNDPDVMKLVVNNPKTGKEQVKGLIALVSDFKDKLDGVIKVWVNGLSVAPDCRGRTHKKKYAGVGRALTSYAVEEGLRRNRPIGGNSTVGVESFYSHLGFKEKQSFVPGKKMFFIDEPREQKNFLSRNLLK